MPPKEDPKSKRTIPSGRDRLRPLARAGQNGMPASAGSRFAAIEVMRVACMMSSGCKRRTEAADLRGINPAGSKPCYPASVRLVCQYRQLADWEKILPANCARVNHFLQFSSGKTLLQHAHKFATIPRSYDEEHEMETTSMCLTPCMLVPE